MYNLEVICVGQDRYAEIKSAIDAFNSAQVEFRFRVPPPRLQSEGLLHAFRRYSTEEVFTFLEEFRTKAKANRENEFLVALLSSPLEGTMTNLFSSVDAERRLAVVTLADYDKFTNSIQRYLRYYLVNVALRFVAPSLQVHQETRGCFFDKKIYKGDIVHSLATFDLCEHCRRRVVHELTPETDAALRAMTDAGRATNGAKTSVRQQVTVMRKSIVELDLVGYSSIARMLEENIAPGTVQELNNQVQRFVDQGLRDVGELRAETVMATTGDGAILLFDRADVAHRFATAIHQATARHNRERSAASAKRWFRVGTATGEVAVTQGPRGDQIAGVAIANAVRLEAAARPGESVIDVATYDNLSDACKVEYGPVEEVRGKRDERFRAHRRTVVSVEVAKEFPFSAESPPEVKPTGGKQRAILKLLEQLHPQDKLDTLMFLLEMPHDQRPSRELSYSDRRARVVDWVTSPGGPGAARLEDELRHLVEKPPPRWAHREVKALSRWAGN